MQSTDVGDVLQRIYDSEINLRIEWFWDGGVKWRLGDDLNGWKEEGASPKIASAVQAIAEAAARTFPMSDFARWWRDRTLH